MPFGLTCSRCLYGHIEDCTRANEMPVAAVVSGIRLLNVKRSCLGTPAPNSPAVCAAERLYQFDQVEFLRNAPGASAGDVFEAHVAYPESFTEDFEKTPAEGPLLEADGRYVVFAVKDRKDMGFQADWYINVACKL